MELFSTLTVPEGWSFHTFHSDQASLIFQGAEIFVNEDPSFVRDLSKANVITTGSSTSQRPKRSGWKAPGPGPITGRIRVPTLQHLTNPLLLALIHITKEAIHFQQLYSFESNTDMNEEMEFTTVMTKLSELENEIPVSKAMRRSIWSTSTQLGVPALLIRLRSPFHAVSLHFLPDRAGQQWFCSICTNEEINLSFNCTHAATIRQSLQQIADRISCSTEYLISSMVQSSAFSHISDLTSTCFYGVRKKLEFAVIRSEQSTFQTPATSATRIHLVKRTANRKSWSCLTRSCAGTGPNCVHRRSVQEHIERGLTHCLPSVFDLMRGQEPIGYGISLDQDTEPTNIPVPRYSRPLIPSESAFLVEFNVNRNARNNTSIVIPAASTCHCGKSLQDRGSSIIAVSNLRVETSRCYVTYQQEIWTCPRGHWVTPEEREETREGLLWISRDTAYTEVFLFDLLLNMTLSGGTISGQADLRSQILFLQTHHMSRQSGPRSNQCVRKALIMYAMTVVKAIPAWVFRCRQCATDDNGVVSYDKLSFDGQQLGFNIRKDVRYDFYGKPATPWRRPVDRCPDATNLSMIIRSKHMRVIVTESLRVREISSECNSVQALCRSMMVISLRGKDAIRAAVAAIKLFDPLWRSHVPQGTPSIDERTFHTFSSTSKTVDMAHPIEFIGQVTNSTEFNRSYPVMNLFHHVLDCSRAAAVISILLNDLRTDLKQHIPVHDKQFIVNYAVWANQMLNNWLSNLSQTNSWALIAPPITSNEAQSEAPNGIGEHAACLDHPFRAPFSWKKVQDITATQNSCKLLSSLRNIEDWVAPPEAQTAVLLFIMAVLTESVTVWIRDGEFRAIRAGIETFRNAEFYSGHQDVSYHCRASLQRVHPIGLVYEGVMGLLGANIASAKNIFNAMRLFLEQILNRYEAYLFAMNNFSSSKSFMCSPKEFDDMLKWTGAIGPLRTNEDINESLDGTASSHSRNMRNMYSKMASSKTNDFLVTGIWAPDLPVRRPSPSSAICNGTNLQADVSCSKDFDIHNAFSPGTFGGYCLCRHSKTIIVSFLKRPEGCRMPLNIIVERCPRLPRYVVYDFACGTQKAALSLSAELTRHVSFVVDPFHFPGHKTCSLAMHEANYSDLRGTNVESQEQRNSSIKVMEKTLRASRDVHFMHFVILGHAYLNLKAMYLDHRDEIHDDASQSINWGSRAWLRWIRDNLF